MRTETITFLFTDIEGSTQLWEQYPDAMRRALSRHDVLLASGIERHGGGVVKSRGEGDSFFAVFDRASDAVVAACAVQQELLRGLDVDLPIRVRMALHTDVAEAREGDYYGPAVNRCARLRAVAHGGQVVLSQTTSQLVSESLPHGASLRDLGVHRLKDLHRPERVFQLLHPELPNDFPPLRSLEAFAHNLPIHLTRFIGREAQIDEIKQLLQTMRLLTLIGTGGCGKTRLALQVAADVVDEYPDGVWLVELALQSDPSRAAESVAMALGVREEPGRPMRATLLDALRPRRLLLLLDNCEHLVGPCADLADALLRASPYLTILATGREALGIVGETLFRVPSLSVPANDQRRMTNDQRLDLQENRSSLVVGRSSAPDTLLASEAVQLFLDRARQSQPGFSVTPQNARAVAQICRQLDGIPLAIELAAAWVKLLSVDQIAARLDDRFRLLTAGSRTALPRHRTLRAAFDWSYDLLSDAERILLRRLSVFVGGFTLEAAEAVCGEVMSDESSLIAHHSDVLHLLAQLVDKSLVVAEVPDLDTSAPATGPGPGDSSPITHHSSLPEVRYRLLETIRQYGSEHLHRSGEAPALRIRHRDWFLRLAEQAEPKLSGPEQAVWLERLDQEHDNLRAALAWSVECSDAEAGLRLARALWQFWWVRGYLGEGRASLAILLDMAGAEGSKRGDGDRRPTTGDQGSRRALAGAGASDTRPTTDDRRATTERAVRAKALHGAGILAYDQGDYTAARALHEESLAIKRELGDKRGISASLNSLGHVARLQGDFTAARALYEESLSIARQEGDRRAMGFALNALGLVARYQGDHASARVYYEESLAIGRDLGDRRGVAVSLNNLGLLAQDRGEYDAARALYEESLSIKQELGDRRGIALSLNGLALIELSLQQEDAALALFDESLAIRRELGDKRGIAFSLYGLGNLASLRGDDESAWALHEESLAIRRELGDKHGVASSLGSLGRITVRSGDLDAAEVLWQESLELFRQLGDWAGLVICLEGIGALQLARDGAERSAQLFGAASAQRLVLGLPLPPCDLPEQERWLAAARSALSEEAFAAAWTAGQALTSEEAVTLAGS